MTEQIDIPIQCTEETLIPKYASSLAAGADVCSAIREDVVILPGNSALIPTGVFLEIPEGFEIQVRPRSGLALKHGVTVLNTPGTIDADYRGELKVILMNHGKEPFTVTYGMRIAQIVMAKVTRAHFLVAAKLGATDRGEKGFGHTGTH